MTRTGRWAWQVARGHPRLGTAVIVGVIAWFAIGHSLAPRTRAVLAYDVAVLVFLAAAAFLFTTERRSRMALDAARQQEGEWTIFALTIAAAVFSLVATLGEFAAIKDAHRADRVLHIALVIVTLFGSWLMVHTTFAFRYAHEFYTQSDGDAPDGGLQFPGKDDPDYLDFVYFALVIGMTFQVSDVQITSRKLRRLATIQGLLAFLFNTVIFALSVNLAAGLV